jgi:hypothetical protein
MDDVGGAITCNYKASDGSYYDLSGMTLGDG